MSRALRPSGKSPFWSVIMTALCACSPGGRGSAGDVEISSFVEDALVSGKVLQNSTACEVDAVCFLRIAFSDTSIVALYGTGERPAPECPMSSDISDVAFRIAPDEVVSVIVSRCGLDGYYLRRLEKASADEAFNHDLMAAAIDSIIAHVPDSVAVCLTVYDDDGWPRAPSAKLLGRIRSRAVVPPAACPETYSAMVQPVDSLGRPVAREPPYGHVDPLRLSVVRYDVEARGSVSIVVNEDQGTVGRRYICSAELVSGEPVAACRIVSRWIS